MISTELTRKAMRIAYTAHHGQCDKAGVPYIFHPAHVAEQMDDEVSTCVALLHDVVEDTSVAFEDLEQVFEPAIIEPLRLLTRSPEVDYAAYIRSIRSDPVATKVKLADLAHNSDSTRLVGAGNPVPKSIAVLHKRYAEARSILLS